MLSNISFHLYQLQKLDSRIDQINKRRQAILTQLKNNQKLSAAENALKQSQEKVQQKENELRELEHSSSTKKIKIQQSEAALYNGKNTNPKELSGLQNEIASLKKAMDTLDEKQLEILSILEGSTLEVKQYQLEYESALADSKSENQDLVKEKESLESEIEKISAERTLIAGQIPAEYMNIYANLFSTKNHHAVTAVEDQCCASCGSELTASDIQKSRMSTSLTYCPFCGRILYAG